MAKTEEAFITRRATAEDFKKPTYKMIAHEFKDKALHWPVCRGCGLVQLKNGFTRWAIKHGCLNEFHPQHETQRRMTEEKE